MKTIISPDAQLDLKPLNFNITKALENREGNKNFVYNYTPFVRVSCLQEVSYTEIDKGKSNNLKEVRNSILTDSTHFNGFQFIFNSNFDEAYGEIQKIGKTLDNKDINIKNPRRVPPPVLKNFTATCGESSDFFTTAKLNFTCNSLEQLQFIVPFLLNPGNTIFVEFGYNSDELKKSITFFDNNDANDLVNSSVIKSGSRSNITKPGFIEKMNNRIYDTGGSYEFFYGIINDFNVSINDSLGFDCDVSLISAPKAKLVAPNVNNYNPNKNKISTEQQKVIAISLQSDLKHFQDELYKRNKKLSKDIIFAFDGSDSSTYVRLDDIFGFLNGEYSKKGISTNRNKLDIAAQTVSNKNSIKLDNILYSTIPVKKATITPNEPPIVSYNSDLLLFRKYMWDPKLSYNDKTGTYDIEDSVNYKAWSDFLSDASYFDVENSSNTSEQIIRTNFKTIHPYKIDETTRNDIELLQNAYINFGKFKSIYLSSNGIVLDTIKKLADMINASTDNMWDLKVVGEAVSKSDNEPEKNITTLLNTSGFSINRTEPTYTFKVDSKHSIFNNINFDVGLEGELGNQIYMNSLNSSNGSLDSQKVNLLLFSNHENHITIKDKRLERIRKIREQLDDLNGGKSTNQSDSEINKQIKSADVRKDFLGRYIVGPANGGSSKRVGDIGLSYNFYNELISTLGTDDPADVTIDNLKKMITDKYRLQLNDQQILNKIFAMYGVELIPLVFSPIKQAVRDLRGNTSPNVQTSDNNNSNNTKSPTGINPLLEAKLDIPMMGIGGINPLQYVKIQGIPDAFSKRGDFVVMNVSHTVTPSSWNTELSTRFRISNDE